MNERQVSSRPKKPAGLVFFEAQEKPRQYVLFDQAVIRGKQEMDVFTTSSLQLTYPFLDEEQCEIRYEDGKWIYKNLSKNTFTFISGKNLPAGEACELHDNAVIRLSNDRMLTAFPFTRAPTQWAPILVWMPKAKSSTVEPACRIRSSPVGVKTKISLEGGCGRSSVFSSGCSRA